MGLLTDILKEIPQAAVLKEKIATIEAKYAAADMENAILKDDFRKANAEITKLKEQVEELTHKANDLHENEDAILMAIVRLDKNARTDQVAEAVGLHIERVRFHLEKLQKIGYIGFVGVGGPRLHYLQNAGREYLITKGVF